MEPMTLGSPIHSPSHPPSFHSHSAAGSGMPSSYNSPSLAGSHSHSPMVHGHGVQGHHTHGQVQPVHGGPAYGHAYHHPHHPLGAAGTPGGFLPGYLMGDVSQQGGGGSGSGGGRMLSPTKLNRSTSHHHGGPSAPATPQPSSSSAHKQQQHAFSTPTATVKGLLTPNTSQARTPSEKPGGPPTTGLFSAALKNSAALGTPTFGTPTGAGATSTPIPTTPQLSFGAPTPNTHLHNQSVRNEIFNSSGACEDGNTWVTVFGFAPSAASYVLSQFSQYGTIVQHQIPPNGNWMHLRYQTKMQSQKALSRANRVLGGSIMIGVCACTDPPLDDSNNSILTHNQSVAGASVNLGHGGDTSVATLNSSLGGTRLNSSIRPLAQAYKGATNEHDISGRTNTPNRNTGIVGKAVECIFGW